MQALRALVREFPSALLGYSGGVDSAFLAVTMRQELGKDRMLAVIGRSASYPDAQWQVARQVAIQFDIPFTEIATHELDDASYLANPSNRCFYCKTELWHRLVPLAAERGEKALLTAAAKRAERWKKILLEASQQCRRVRVPVLGELAKAESIFSASKNGLRVMLSERAMATPLRRILEGQRTTRVIMAIGPEGGWTDAEFEAARSCGFLEASLGRLILRTETAVIAALASLNYALDRE